ncbi:MAG: MASE1 domain-containing protein [Lentisphaerales bacterium]|nr:MASE1 domain-containing protein [Lentisphaerales bacterium]
MELETFKKKPFVTGCIFAIVYALVAQLSLTLAFQDSNASPIWPPSGLAITLIFLLGKQYCPAIFAGAFIANLLTFSSHTPLSLSTVTTSFFIGIGNTLEAFIAFTFFKLAMEHKKPLKSPSTFLVYLAISMAACFGCAFFASFVLWQSEMISSSLFNTILLTWWLGDFIGILTVGTFLLSLSLDHKTSKENQLEYILTLISVSIISIIIFSQHDPNSLLSRFYFIILPIFIWITFRFNLLKTLFAINLMAILATLGTANGKGPFQSHSVNDSLLLMQCYIGIITITFVLFKLQIFNSKDSTETKEHYSSSLKAQWLALLTFCLSIIATIVIAGSHSLKDKEKTSILVLNELQNATMVFKSQLTSTIQALERLADRQSRQKQANNNLWSADSNAYLSHIPMLESLDYRDANGKVLFTNQVNHDNSTNNFEAQTAVAQKHYFERLKNSTKPTISSPFIFKDKATRILIHTPSLNDKGEITGSLLVVCLFDKLMNDFLAKYIQDFNFKMIIDNKTAYQTSDDNSLEYEESIESYLYNLSWSLTASPTNEKLAILKQKEWGTHILLGLFLSILLTTTIYQSINSNLKADEFEEMNNRLNKKNSELVKQKIVSRQAAQAKDSFLTNISHEIRTPMNGVLGAVQLAKECRPDELEQYLRVIDVSAKSLMEIIDEVLEYSSLESGEITIEIIDFNLRTLIEDSVKIIESAATVKGLQVKTFISENLREYVQGDPVRLKQILLNLLSNALKFTDKGNITINVTEDFNETIKIEVIDTGIGIPEHQIKKIFNHFEQLDMSSTRGVSGAGLGLSICRSLISMMAGSINVISTEGEGSNFILKVPLIPGHHPQKQSSIKKSDFYSKKILLCEDNQANSLIMKKMLEKLGLQVSTAEDGRKALSTLVCEWEKLDLILMDLEMPHIGGLEVANVVREQIPNFDVPIVALTANCSAEDREMCERAGMKGFLAKPISKEKLAEEINRWLTVSC